MKLNLLCTPSGLVPMYDADYDEKKRLRAGETYEAEIRLQRNPKFHRKFFSLLSASWSLLPEKTSNGFRSIEGFRAYVTVAAGFYELYYNPRLKAFVEMPKSIRFDKMDEAEFSDLYERVKDVIWAILGKSVSQEDFERVLMSF